MEPNIVPQYTRSSPIALALVLALLLAGLALRAEANEEETAPPVREQIRQNADERRALYEDNRTERIELREENRLELGETITARREALQARATERRTAMEERQEAVKARLGESVQQRLTQHVTRMTERMTATLDRLEIIAEKIESRIKKIEEVRTVDITNARTELTDAQRRIGEARDDVAFVLSLAQEALASEDPRTHMEDVRDATKLAKDSIVAVHRALRDVVVEIKASVVAGAEREGVEDSSTQ